jgi:hypothetical protein
MMKRIATITERGEPTIGCISEPGSSDALVFHRVEVAWEPVCRVQAFGPTIPLPSCFSPRQELLTALNVALVTQEPVEFEMEL